MSSSPVNFLFLLFLVCIAGWVVFTFAASLVAWILSRILGATVRFKVAGFNCVRDVNIKFKKGAVESVSVGEFKLSMRKSLVKLSMGVISRDPKLQLLISELEVIVRRSQERTKTNRTQKTHSYGRGKWMVLANLARFLSVSIADLVVKLPKPIIETKDLSLELFKSGGSNPVLNVRLNFSPLLVFLGESRLDLDNSGDVQTSSSNAERDCAPFRCEEISVCCEFGHDREVGIATKNVDVTAGEVVVNFTQELFSVVKSESSSAGIGVEGLEMNSSKRGPGNKQSILSLRNKIFLFPDKVSFVLPKLDLRLMNHDHDLLVENNVMGIILRCCKSFASDDSGESASHLDVQLEFSEIHLFRKNNISLLEIIKGAVLVSVDIPFQPIAPIRAETDVRLGGTQVNVIVDRLLQLFHLSQSKKKKKVSTQKGNSLPEVQQLASVKAIMWTCTISAPEMITVLYSVEGLPLYHICSQSSHLFANNIANMGTQTHAEFGELDIYTADENHECFKESLFGIIANSGSLLHLSRVSLDCGFDEVQTHEDSSYSKNKSIISIDITGMGINFNFQHIQSLVTSISSFRTLLQSIIPNKRSSVRKHGYLRKKTSAGKRFFSLNIEQCSVVFSGEVGVEEAVIPDPKRVNYGSQGGEVVVSFSTDGSPRQAHLTSTISDHSTSLKNSFSIDISHMRLCIYEDKQSVRVELERSRLFYLECYQRDATVNKITLLDIQNAKFVRRLSVQNDVPFCSLFSATDISVRWEPDVHLALYELFLCLRHLLHHQKSMVTDNLVAGEFHSPNLEMGKDHTLGNFHVEEQHNKRKTVFAIDVEILRVSAEVADGVEAKIHVQSIFSENAEIGILLEGLILSFNSCTVFKSSRMQISRLPVFLVNPINVKGSMITKWDWVIQGLDIHICMPYRLQLRAIEDAIEDTYRALKLIIANKTSTFFPRRKDNSKKAKSKLSTFGSIRFNIHLLTAEIEEEPIQGWLDEHYKLLKNEVCELNARLKFLDTVTSEKLNSSMDGKSELCSEFKTLHDDIDIHDESAVRRLCEEIHRKTFLSYYKSCQQIKYAEGSGACKNGFHSGFKPSTNRSSLLALRATELDMTLTAIEGGTKGMIDFIKRMDTTALECEIPFSRAYGRDVALFASSLVVQLRDYSLPLFSGTSGKCKGCIVFAQQATCFQPQIEQDIYVGRSRKVRMLRSASGTTPPMKMYSDLPISFQKGEMSFGVGFEPAFADISYAFTVALRRANLSVKSSEPSPMCIQTNKRERSLQWWDNMRYYMHGRIQLKFTKTIWNVLATTNPYESLDKFQIDSGYMDIQQSDGNLTFFSKDFKIYISSLESLINKCSLNVPAGVSVPFIESPCFFLKISMDWECESGNPLNHYLHALPVDGESKKKVYDPFRSTSLSLKWNFELKPSMPSFDKDDPSCSTTDGSLHGTLYGNMQKSFGNLLVDSPKMNIGAYDVVWIFRFWSLNYNPPHKLRSFSRWPRFGIPRSARSGNLSLDKVMTEFFLRIDSTPACIKHMTLGEDDPAKSLTFTMTMLKYEKCYSRGKQRYTFDCKRDPLDLIYQGLDLHSLKVHLKNDLGRKHQDGQPLERGQSRTKNEKGHLTTEVNLDEGFLLSSDYFMIRKQAPKGDPARLLAWQDTGRKKQVIPYVRVFENGSESDQTRSASDDDGVDAAIDDNCQRVFVYGLKLLWTIENRDAVWSWVGGISKAFESPKPSPSRQYAQRRLIERNHKHDASQIVEDDLPNQHPLPLQNPVVSEISGLHCPESQLDKIEANEESNDKEEGVQNFMVNVIQPQFNLHSEEANGRFLLAAASGHVLARSFHKVVHVGYEMIEKTLGTPSMKISDYEPELTWKRAEYSVMLEHVQSHVAPTDVDPGAGLQWLPEIPKSSPKVKRTGALLERVFMPCEMYFRYTRHKGATAELKVKPLKELTFNSNHITATMTSRQFQVMLDVLSNLLFARLPKPQKNTLSFPVDDDEDAEEADEVVPDGVEEVELAKINLEQRERERRLLLSDIRTILTSFENSDILLSPEKESDFWMLTSGKSELVRAMKKELGGMQQSRKAASISLRRALHKAAQLRLMEKETNKSPSCAMRISLRINKVVWTMLSDGKSFADAEINNLVYDFDRDYKDIGIAKFTTQSFEVRNCLPNAKSDMLLAPWNAPPEWGKHMMLKVDAKQGAPNEGTSSLELFQVEIYPLRIHLTETMYRMMWEYFFPEEEQDSQRRQEVWKVSTTAGSRRSRKHVVNTSISSSNFAIKEFEASSSTSGTISSLSHSESMHILNLQGRKAISYDLTPAVHRTSSFDRTWEDNTSEAIENETILQIHSLSSKSGPLNPTPEHYCVTNEENQRLQQGTKPIKTGRLSHEEKKVGKSQDDKRARSRKMMEFRNIKISQVELLVTYEGSRFAVNDLRLLMDTFHRVDFMGTWRRLFSRVKKHIIWGVLKSVTGMQGKKFKDKAQSHRQASSQEVPNIDLDFSDSDGGQPGKGDQFAMSWLRRPSDGAGDGFVSSIKGLFSSQRRRAQLSIRRHARKLKSKGQKVSGTTSQQRQSLPSSARETPYQSDYSGTSSPYEDPHD